jgi:hypothetical protein
MCFEAASDRCVGINGDKGILAVDFQYRRSRKLIESLVFAAQSYETNAYLTEVEVTYALPKINLVRKLGRSHFERLGCYM